MSSDANQNLMEILGLLSEATKRITDMLRGVSSGPSSIAVARAPAPAAAPQDSPAPVPVESALDRIQEFQEAGAPAEDASQRRGRRGRLTISEADLKKLYVDEGKTAKQIAEIYGVAPGTVAQRVMKLGLSKRGPSPMKGKSRKK
jgi:hypothetical protein